MKSHGANRYASRRFFESVIQRTEADNVIEVEQTYPSSLVRGIGLQRNLREQLQIDQQVDTAIDLVPQCSLLW